MFCPTCSQVYVFSPMPFCPLLSFLRSISTSATWAILVLHTLDMCPDGICMFGPALDLFLHIWCVRVYIHSPNDDIFASCRVALEFLPGGLVVPTITVYRFLLDRYPPETSSQKIGAESLFFCTYVVQKLHSSATTGHKLML